jgi:hypothetical protein
MIFALSDAMRLAAFAVMAGFFMVERNIIATAPILSCGSDPDRKGFMVFIAFAASPARPFFERLIALSPRLSGHACHGQMPALFYWASFAFGKRIHQNFK